jgi:hypothetical protein
VRTIARPLIADPSHAFAELMARFETSLSSQDFQ